MGEMVSFRGGTQEVTGYLALPRSGKGPGLLLMHAWWGLTDFFTGLADRLASEGFVVLAPDLYGGETTAQIPDAERLINKLDYRQAIQAETGAADYLLAHPAVHGKGLGTIGFSMGGAYATWLASIKPEVAAVVLFYGGSEQEKDYASRTRASFLGHFSDSDEWEPVTDARRLESSLQAAGREATFYYYPGASHWFFESNRSVEYDPAIATVAWQRTVEFLHRTLDPAGGESNQG